MRVLLLSAGIFLCSQANGQQPTKAQMEKMQKDLEKKAAQQQKSLEASDQYKAVSGDEDKFMTPKKRTALLAAIPKKTFTAAEYSAYLKSLLTKFETLPSNKASIAYVKKYHNHKTAREFHFAAFLLWYKGKQPEAVYCALKSSSLDPGNMLSLNNLCALLNMSGYPHKAIPLLKYAMTKQNGDAAILNNIGQAHYQLGDLSTSQTHLTNCTRVEPNHIEANNTLGHINTANGNTAAASQCYQNSLQGGYNRSAASQLGKAGKQPADAMRLPPPNSYPETDDNIGFSCPSISDDVKQNVVFNMKLSAESEAFDNMQTDYNARINEAMQQRGMQIANAMMSGRTVNMQTGVMFEKTSLVMAKAFVDFTETLKRLSDEWASWKEALDQRYAEQFQNACRGVSDDLACCRIRLGIQSSKQGEFAQRYNQFCSQMWGNAKGYSNVVAYWTPFLSKQRGNILDKDLMNARNTLISTAFSLTRMAGVEIDFCLEEVDPIPVTKTPNFPDPECSFTLKVPIVIGEFKIDCEKMSFSGGEGIVGEVEFNFRNCQSTVAIGIGGQVQSGVFNAEASAKYYVTFDGNLNMQDAGIKYSAGVSAGGINTGPLKFEAINVESAVTVGINSGVTASTSASVLNNNILSKETSLYSFSDN